MTLAIRPDQGDQNAARNKRCGLIQPIPPFLSICKVKHLMYDPDT